MGHSDISVTMNTYIHVKFQDAQEDFKKQLIHNDLMKMREKWLNASIYLNPQFLTCRFLMADLPLVQTWNLPKFLPKLMTKICKDMPKYARISEKWRKVKRLEKPENKGNMGKIKILFVCHGTPVDLIFWIASFPEIYRKILRCKSLILLNILLTNEKWCFDYPEEELDEPEGWDE